MSKYFSHGMAPYVYDWRGRAYGANQQNSMVRSELGGVMDALKTPIGIGAVVAAAIVIYPKLFGSGKVRVRGR